jgi:hypothetical protein
MRVRKRFGLSAEQKGEVWCRWKAGQTLHEIARAFGKEHSSIRCRASRHGGIAPAIRRRAPLAHVVLGRFHPSGNPVNHALDTNLELYRYTLYVLRAPSARRASQA